MCNGCDGDVDVNGDGDGNGDDDGDDDGDEDGDCQTELISITVRRRGLASGW